MSKDTPEKFYSVAEWYEDFSLIRDDDVRDVVAAATQPQCATIQA